MGTKYMDWEGFGRKLSYLQILSRAGVSVTNNGFRSGRLDLFVLIFFMYVCM
jgi:hypothetical protein